MSYRVKLTPEHKKTTRVCTKTSLMYKSRKFFISFLFFLCSCAISAQHTEIVSDKNFEDQDLLEQWFVDSHVVLESLFSAHYTERLVAKLLPMDKQREKWLSAIRVKIVRDKEVFSFSTPSSIIFISTALVRNLRGESELAFVIAHELGHILLGHHRAGKKNVSLEKSVREKMELAADSFALRRIALAGFNPAVSLFVLSRIYGSATCLQGNLSHPGLKQRLLKMSIEMKRYVRLRSAPAVTFAREFAIFRQGLIE